jgi:uncharacterized protein YjdB
MNAMRLCGRLAALIFLASIVACSKKPASIQVTPRKLSLFGLERGERLTARVLDSKGREIADAKPTWSSSQGDVATVDEGGRVVAKSEGKATIAARLGDLSAEVPVEVVDAATVEIVPAQATLVGPAGTAFPLTAVVKSSKARPLSVPLSWTSSDEKVVRVDKDGMLTSVANGTATVTAHAADLQGGAEVAVLVQDISRLEVRPATALVRVGDTQRFQVVAYGSDGNRLDNATGRFRSSNPAVATIDGAGVASGVTAGTTTIRVDLAGRTAEATLIVN